MKVLIIEDEAMHLKLARLVLSTDGHQVVETTTAEGALALVQQHQPDVILLDLKLPGMDGLTFARQLKENPPTSHIPIVAVTAYPNLWRQEQALAAGCQCFLLKPIDTRALSRQIVACVTDRQADTLKRL
jgi:CheY-like chemotaxis protein